MVADRNKFVGRPEARRHPTDIGEQVGYAVACAQLDFGKL
jgi:hypothetical protein